VIDLRESPTWNLQRIAKAKGKKVQDCTAVILDRDRHAELIAEVPPGRRAHPADR